MGEEHVKKVEEIFEGYQKKIDELENILKAQ